jgi:hypothetical protein
VGLGDRIEPFLFEHPGRSVEKKPLIVDARR